MRSFLKVLSTVLLLVTVALVSALVTMRLAVHGREVAVPDLSGKTPSEARRIAESIGLTSQIDRQYYSTTIPEGRVISQTPAPKSVVRRGWNVRLAVSLGPQRVNIPQVVGQSQRAAGIVLDQRSLDSSIVEVSIPGAVPGQVLGQDPTANAADVAAPKVNLLVASNSPTFYVMPSFVGRPLGSVSLAIKDAGFPPPKVTLVNSTSPVNPTNSSAPAPDSPKNPSQGIPSPAAMVVSQQPAAGQKIQAGSEVRLWVR